MDTFATQHEKQPLPDLVGVRVETESIKPARLPKTESDLSGTGGSVEGCRRTP